MENKEDQINPNVVEQSASNFSWMENLKLNDLESTSVTNNAISQANIADELMTKKGEVKFENLERDSQANQISTGNIVLGSSGVIGWVQSKYHNHYWTLFLISFCVILVTWIASIVLRLYSRYIYFASQPVPNMTYQTYIDRYKNIQDFVDKTLDLSNYQQYTTLSFVGSIGEVNLNSVIDEKRLSYIQKKDIIQKAFNDFSSIFVKNNQKLGKIKEDISKYGFFSQEIYYMLEDQSYSTSIKKYLLSLEIIKFSSAIKVFGYLDTFISSLGNELKMWTIEVETNMKKLADRGEKDIVVYLNNCYLNPYEIDYDCDLVGDFDRYYALIDKEETPPNIDFFKKMMYYVDTKLEQTDLPSFSITFKRYDPTQKEVGFTVDVNTFKQDELALIKKWIINPHIFILSNLLNLIKQSIFVVSENIDVKSVKIASKVIKIGTSVFNVNNSTMDFILPIQKWSEREISDYVNPIFISLP